MRQLALGDWPLAKDIRIVAASLDFLMSAMPAVSCDPGDSPTLPRAAGQRAAKPKPARKNLSIPKFTICAGTDIFAARAE